MIFSKDIRGRSIPFGSGVSGHVIATGRMVCLNSPSGDWRFEEEEKNEEKRKIKNILALPVKDHLGKNVSVIEVVNKRVRKKIIYSKIL
jgi:hypothetical protein